MASPNAVSSLNLLAQRGDISHPHYKCERAGGPDNTPTFKCTVAAGKHLVTARGSNKRAAKEKAAQRFLDHLEEKRANQRYPPDTAAPSANTTTLRRPTSESSEHGYRKAPHASPHKAQPPSSHSQPPPKTYAQSARAQALSGPDFPTPIQPNTLYLVDLTATPPMPLIRHVAAAHRVPGARIVLYGDKRLCDKTLNSIMNLRARMDARAVPDSRDILVKAWLPAIDTHTRTTSLLWDVVHSIMFLCPQTPHVVVSPDPHMPPLQLFVTRDIPATPLAVYSTWGQNGPQ